MIYLLLIVAVIVLDRVVKIAVSTNMDPGDTIPVIDHIFHITYVQNTGAAFSMLQGHSMLLIILPAVVIGIGIIFVCVMSKKYNKMFLVSVSLICGGGLGNLTDRISQGYVTDMFDFRVFPVFNVADICVCVGCGLMMLYMIIDMKRSEGNGSNNSGQNGR
ncbi:MAG: signal peptidase II [Firmicutes bacterium]|nr:signal peptidase II [Bacillota bacterium]